MGRYIEDIDISHAEEDISSMFSHQFSKEPLTSERHFIIPDKLGKGKIRRMKIKKGLEIVISDIELAKDLTVYVEANCKYLEINYCLSGKTTYEMNDQQFKIWEPKGHVYYSDHTKAQWKLKANVRSHTVEIRISPERLFGYFENEKDKKRIREMLEKQKGHMTSYQISPLIKKCIFEILQCPYRGTIKNFYFEAKVMELITLFFQEETFCLRHSNHSLENEEIKKLKKSRDIIMKRLDDPYSIKELAKRVGLNEFQLKKGFRQLYGTTIFSLIRSQRMEKAAWLMKMKGYNVSETASSIGYSNFSNFTVAFRKYFGCNPSEYLKYINRQ